MKKKLKLTLLLGGMALACVGAGCGTLTPVEENKEAGYLISVTYDANGGSFLNRPGITVMDMFHPDKYEADAQGIKHIKLIEPTDPSRPTSGSDSITLTLQNHFVAGWYQNREVKTVDGKPVDEAGKELALLENGTYVYADTVDEEKPTEATPAYNYSGYWDFEKDTINYKEGESVDMTLYAGWVPYYEFHYYYKKDNKWTKLDETTSFDYKMTNASENQADKDTIFLPRWDDGAMNYKKAYMDNSEYVFPSIAGTTFEKAYEDEACTKEITDSLEHKGVLKAADGETKALVVENRVQNIYLTVTAGEQYRITKPEQLVKYANAKGYYELAVDMDFTGLSWPMSFASGEFTGKMYGKDGAKVTLRNITVEYSADTAYGGLFGKVAKGATIKDIAFENVTLDLIKTGRHADSAYGLFAGEVETGATVSVEIGGKIKIGKITPVSTAAFHLVANDTRTGITAKDIGLAIYGEQLMEQYEYTVNPETVQVSDDGTITFSFYPSSELKNEKEYIIQ